MAYGRVGGERLRSLKGPAARFAEAGCFLSRLLDNKYGPGNYPQGARSEFSKIQKWGDRSFQDPLDGGDAT